MNKIHYLTALFIILICSSCKNKEQTGWSKNSSKIKDTAWLEFPSKITIEDSIEIELFYYFEEFDTIRTETKENRQTHFFFTSKNLPYDSIKDIVTSHDIKRSKEVNLNGAILTGKHKNKIRYKFKEKGIYHFTGFINDTQFFMTDKDKEEGTEKIHQTYINQEIKVTK